MLCYSFSILLAGEEELSDEMSERLFSACHDITPSSSAGVVQVAFDREAESLEAAIRSAVSDLRRSGDRPGELRTMPEELVSA